MVFVLLCIAALMGEQVLGTGVRIRCWRKRKSIFQTLVHFQVDSVDEYLKAIYFNTMFCERQQV